MVSDVNWHELWNKTHLKHPAQTSGREMHETSVKYPLYCIDFENLCVSLSMLGREMGRRITPTDAFNVILPFFPLEGYYYVIWCTKDPRKYDALPPSENSERHLESARKWNKERGEYEIMDIDTTLASLATAYLIENVDYISKVYLGTGDIDLKPVATRAKECGIPVIIIAADQASVNLQWHDIADDVQFLFRLKSSQKMPDKRKLDKMKEPQ